MAKRISIYRDNVWAGDGRLAGGEITDCPAVLGADQDESEAVYELIQDAIEADEDSVEVHGHEYTWVIG